MTGGVGFVTLTVNDPNSGIVCYPTLVGDRVLRTDQDGGGLYLECGRGSRANFKYGIFVKAVAGWNGGCWTEANGVPYSIFGTLAGWDELQVRGDAGLSASENPFGNFDTVARLQVEALSHGLVQTDFRVLPSRWTRIRFRAAFRVRSPLRAINSTRSMVRPTGMAIIPGRPTAPMTATAFVPFA